METEILSNIEQAKAIAKLVEKEMGKDFFTIDDMRKKLVKSDGRFLKKISWQEARNYTDFLNKYGFCEISLSESAHNTQYRIRFDIKFRKEAYQNQKELYEQKISEINIVLSLLDQEYKKHAPAKKAVKKSGLKKSTSTAGWNKPTRKTLKKK